MTSTMYQNAAGGGAGHARTETPSSGQASGDDDVIDAEYEDVA
jgi:hypothetical protein